MRNFNNIVDCYILLYLFIRIKNRLNLDMMGVVNVIFCFRDFVLLYFFLIGLVVVKMDVLVFKVVCN